MLASTWLIMSPDVGMTLASGARVLGCARERFGLCPASLSSAAPVLIIVIGSCAKRARWCILSCWGHRESSCSSFSVL